MPETSKSLLLPIVAAAVFAGLGRMVWQKARADSMARNARTAGPMDEETRQRISEAMRTPLQQHRARPSRSAR